MSNNALNCTRDQDFSKWYQEAVNQAELAEMSHVRGCMVMKPWGYGIWETIKKHLNERIKETGHENVYFPLFIPLSYIEKEAKHVEGFAQEMAVVTHHRLTKKDGKLVPAGKLAEPIIVRPTSEAIISESFALWIESYRDLPILINQWANVVRWEMRPRIFLRTTEFLWQEGHTAHATAEEAQVEALKMFKVYENFLKDYLALPVIPGEKPEYDRFPGAEITYTVEAMMQDGKALQSGTSHYLGQSFAKAANIVFQSKDGNEEYVHSTSWGVSTRVIGGLIMAHGDDDGVRIPPRVAPYQVVIIPMLKDETKDSEVVKYCHEIKKKIKKIKFFENQNLECLVDEKAHRPVDKKWKWIKKGAPIILEIGGRELADNTVFARLRSRVNDKPISYQLGEFCNKVVGLLDEIQQQYYDEAKAYLEKNTISTLKTFDEFKEYFISNKKAGFVRAKWSGDKNTENILKELQLSIRCLPQNQSNTKGKCILTGKDATIDAIFARAY